MISGENMFYLLTLLFIRRNNVIVKSVRGGTHVFDVSNTFSVNFSLSLSRLRILFSFLFMYTFLFVTVHLGFSMYMFASSHAYAVTPSRRMQCEVLRSFSIHGARRRHVPEFPSTHTCASQNCRMPLDSTGKRCRNT